MIFLPTPGALVANRFRLRHPIGKGGMGQVWEAHDRELDSACAIKFILDHLARDPDARSRLVREARAVARLRSPHVVTILGVGEHADAMYLAMELLEGQTLASRLERSRRLDGATTLAIVDQVVQVLDRAHAHGIVHRDLKPDNIWLSAGTPPFIKVLDFGVAKSTLKTGEKHTATGALMGTPHYMSPEQAAGDREVDHRSDLWALAVIAMECLTSRRPFESSGLGDLLMKIMQSRPPLAQELDPTLPPALNPWWQRALAHDLEARFQTASELAQGLRAALNIPLSVATAGPSPFLETSRGTWNAAPVERAPTLVTKITPAPLTGPAPQPEVIPSTMAQPFLSSSTPPLAPEPREPPALARPATAPAVIPAAMPPVAPPVARTTQPPLGVDSTQVADAPPPLTEPMTAHPANAASFPFRSSDAGSVGALTQTASGRVGARRLGLWLALSGCVLLALGVTWWRLREPELAADLGAPREPAVAGAAAPERSVAHSLQPEAAGTPPVTAAAREDARREAPVVVLPSPVGVRPAQPSPSAAAVSPLPAQPVPTQAPRRGLLAESEPVADRNAVAPTVAPAVAPTVAPTVAPVRPAPPPRATKAPPRPRSARPKASKPRPPPAPRKAPAGDDTPSAAELQRRLGF